MKINYQELLNQAIDASKMTYSPYSNFPVGAALMTGDGDVFLGCNIENSSYSLCICAERTASVKAVSAGKKDFKAMAIISPKIKPCFPCGACLQFLSEFGSNMELILEDVDGNPVVKKISDFLPNMFTPKSLQGI